MEIQSQRQQQRNVPTRRRHRTTWSNSIAVWVSKERTVQSGTLESQVKVITCQDAREIN